MIDETPLTGEEQIATEMANELDLEMQNERSEVSKRFISHISKIDNSTTSLGKLKADEFNKITKSIYNGALASGVTEQTDSTALARAIRGAGVTYLRDEGLVNNIRLVQNLRMSKTELDDGLSLQSNFNRLTASTRPDFTGKLCIFKPRFNNTSREVNIKIEGLPSKRLVVNSVYVGIDELKNDNFYYIMFINDSYHIGFAFRNTLDFFKRKYNNLATPVGSIIMWPNNSIIPYGFLRCVGGTFNKVTYPELWQVWKDDTRLASGDNIILPDFRNRFVFHNNDGLLYREATSALKYDALKFTSNYANGDQMYYKNKGSTNFYFFQNAYNYYKSLKILAYECVRIGRPNRERNVDPTVCVGTPKYRGKEVSFNLERNPIAASNQYAPKAVGCFFMVKYTNKGEE